MLGNDIKMGLIELRCVVD